MQKNVWLWASIFSIMLCAMIFFIKSNNRGGVMLTLSSNSFTNRGEIPAKFTCKGENISPELSWQISASEKLKSYVLIVDDPDAQRVVDKTFVHWIVLLPASINALPEGASSKNGSSVPGIELLNDFRTTQYGGPCPPQGTGVHTYRFTLFALSESEKRVQENPLFAELPCTAEQFAEAFDTAIIAQARVTGTFVVTSR